MVVTEISSHVVAPRRSAYAEEPTSLSRTAPTGSGGGPSSIEKTPISPRWTCTIVSADGSSPASGPGSNVTKRCLPADSAVSST